MLRRALRYWRIVIVGAAFWAWVAVATIAEIWHARGRDPLKDLAMELPRTAKSVTMRSPHEEYGLFLKATDADDV